MKLVKILLWLNATVFVLFGIACALIPAQLAELTVGAIPATASAMTDFRAVYGGLMIGVGLFLTACAANAPRLGMQAVFLIMLGMASTRILGMLADGSPNAYMQLYLGAEIFMAVVAGVLLRSTSGPNEASVSP